MVEVEDKDRDVQESNKIKSSGSENKLDVTNAEAFAQKVPISNEFLSSIFDEWSEKNEDQDQIQSQYKTRSCPLYVRICNLLYAAVLPGTFMVFILFWTLVYQPPFKMLKAFSHGVNFLVMLLDCFVNNQPFRLLHIVYFMSYATTYVAWTGLFHVLGLERSCTCWNFVDNPEDEGGKFIKEELQTAEWETKLGEDGTFLHYYELGKPIFKRPGRMLGCRNVSGMILSSDPNLVEFDEKFVDFADPHLDKCNNIYGVVNWHDKQFTSILSGSILLVVCPIVYHFFYFLALWIRIRSRWSWSRTSSAAPSKWITTNSSVSVSMPNSEKQNKSQEQTEQQHEDEQQIKIKLKTQNTGLIAKEKGCCWLLKHEYQVDRVALRMDTASWVGYYANSKWGANTDQKGNQQQRKDSQQQMKNYLRFRILLFIIMFGVLIWSLVDFMVFQIDKEWYEWFYFLTNMTLIMEVIYLGLAVKCTKAAQQAQEQ